MICKEELVKRFDDYVCYFNAYCTSDAEDHEMLKEVLALLKEQETVEHACDILRANGWKETEPLCSECEAVHVVRCKDCTLWERKNESSYGYCNACKHGYHSPNWEIGIYRLYKEDFFCADGERSS